MLFFFVMTAFAAVVGAQSSLDIIPGPQKVRIHQGSLEPHQLKFLHVGTADRKMLQAYIQKQFANRNIVLHNTGSMQNGKGIYFIEDRTLLNKEAYRLKIDAGGVTITAASAPGFFYGVQTLLQLMDFNRALPYCSIEDTPAFSWRGYVVDVGRNYQSVNKLKEQIDVMARYKLNVFHFHATEDIAWRFESKKYPQLNAAINMLRNPGAFYAEADIKELMQYCKERQILFLPEIDMPGHSAAFTRAFGTTMQSEAGIKIVKELLSEFLDTYHPEYFHVGGDEVKITNNHFLPEVTTLLEQKGVKTVGWSPGGNIGDHTIRQMWMREPLDTTKGFQFVDSRHLYLNHMDPLETVTTIFYRQIGDVPREDKNIKGALLCLWPDRRLEQETDAFKMNAVYPGLLSFAERVWKGGGIEKWQSNIGTPGEERVTAFSRFENILLAHKRVYFPEKDFPYAKQQSIVWDLYGPYDNRGDLSKKFEPELSSGWSSTLHPVKQIVGGTIILRHWWAPLIEGAIGHPKDSTTIYATTKIWCDKAGPKKFWIGFNDLSRSPATDSPPVGKWDDKESRVWVNGQPVAPPHWKRGGEKGNPEIPLIDEGYSYRPPTVLYLKKGWNKVLIKAPVSTLRGKNWENPVKWMFTFVPAPANQ
ncbi:beta-N-acetylhexosaminidase [Niabella sp. 3A5MI-3]|nr:beta-N-acetylhexosaminidase [Niabella beijingensis]